MNTIDETYKPFDFTKNKTYVIQYAIQNAGYMRIEHKLPSFIQHITGVLFTVSEVNSKHEYVGIISLNFNGQSSKSLQLPVPKTDLLSDSSQAIPFEEEIKPNSFLQGYFFDNSKSKKFPYTLSIYIHYKIED